MGAKNGGGKMPPFGKPASPLTSPPPWNAPVRGTGPISDFSSLNLFPPRGKEMPTDPHRGQAAHQQIGYCPFAVPAPGRAFYKKQAMRLPIRNTPRVFDCSDEDQDFMGIPRGCMEPLLERDCMMAMSMIPPRVFFPAPICPIRSIRFLRPRRLGGSGRASWTSRNFSRAPFGDPAFSQAPPARRQKDSGHLWRHCEK